MPQGRLRKKYIRKRHLRVVVVRALLERKVRPHGSRRVGGDDRTCPVANRLPLYSSPFLLRPPFLLSLHMSLYLAEACRYPLECGRPKMAQCQVQDAFAVTGSFSSSLVQSHCFTAMHSVIKRHRCTLFLPTHSSNDRFAFVQ